jgi:serine/threonine protein kinase
MVQFSVSPNGQLLRDGLQLDIPGLKFEEQIGRGANGSVFRSREVHLDREVAVKVWNRTLLDPKSRAIEEVKKLANIAHTSFVRVFQFAEIEGTPYAIMEIVVGKSLKQWLQQSADYASRIHIWTQLSAALRHIYSEGVLHGDPHLGNVMLSPATIGFSAPSLEGSYVPMRTKYKVSILDTGTSRMWRDHRDFEMREKLVLVESIDKLFGRHCLVRTVEVKPSTSLNNILKIGDLLAIVFAAACSGPPQGSENMEELAEELDFVRREAPRWLSQAIRLECIRRSDLKAAGPKLRFGRT